MVPNILRSAGHRCGHNSRRQCEGCAMPKDLRTPGPAPRTVPSGLDEVDLRLLELLAADGRTTNAALAEAVGIAPSTCLARVRALRERGAIRGIHADVDLAQLG